MSSIAFLLVTCSKEPTRADILSKVVDNIRTHAPELLDTVTVFDNASTEEGTKELLCNTFSNVYQSDKNVGYWSAIDWWLENQHLNPATYTYIIESDVIHYAFDKIWSCAKFLDRNLDVGSVRLLEYSIANRRFYNKDAPVPGSRISAWQSHTNKITGGHVYLEQGEDDVWRTTFLTQLCALNRYDVLLESFRQLRQLPKFSEFDFQKLYWQRYNVTGILDGGIFHGDLSVDLKQNAAIGSWTDPTKLKEMGYQPTRYASIVPQEEYTVSRLT